MLFPGCACPALPGHFLQVASHPPCFIFSMKRFLFYYLPNGLWLMIVKHCMRSSYAPGIAHKMKMSRQQLKPKQTVQKSFLCAEKRSKAVKKSSLQKSRIKKKNQPKQPRLIQRLSVISCSFSKCIVCDI